MVYGLRSYVIVYRSCSCYMEDIALHIHRYLYNIIGTMVPKSINEIIIPPTVSGIGFRE